MQYIAEHEEKLAEHEEKHLLLSLSSIFLEHAAEQTRQATEKLDPWSDFVDGFRSCMSAPYSAWLATMQEIQNHTVRDEHDVERTVWKNREPSLGRQDLERYEAVHMVRV